MLSPKTIQSIKGGKVKEIKVGVDTKLFVPLEELHGIQKNLKEMSTERYEKCRKTLVEDGIKFALHVWQGKHEIDGREVFGWWIIDGHGRVSVLRRLAEKEGYTIPPVPCVQVYAENLRAAKLLVLNSSSSYNRMTKEGLYEFATEMDLTPEELKELYDFSDLDIDEYIEEYYEKPPEDEEDVKEVPSEQQFLVVIECPDELGQQDIFQELAGRGFSCKLMS